MTNYIELEIDGQRIGLKFGLPAVRRISEAGVLAPIYTENGNYNELGIAYVLLAGYENNLLIKELPAALKLGFFNDYVERIWCDKDDNPQPWADVMAVLEFFSKSFVVSKLLEKGKKKMETETTTLLSPTPNTGTSSNPIATDNSD